MEFPTLWMLIVYVLPGVGAVCYFPSSLYSGQWLVSRSGARVTFNQSEVTGLYFKDTLDIKPPIGTLFDCILARGNKYVIRSRQPSTISKPRFVFICLHFLSTTPNIVTFVQASRTGPGIKPLYSKFDTLEALDQDPIQHVCDLPIPYHPSRYHVLVREGATLTHQCPELLYGSWRSRGLCGSTLDVCDNSSIHVHYQHLETCASTAPFFPGPKPSKCVWSIQSGVSTYLTVYNEYASVPFVCAVLQKTEGIIYMSHRAWECSMHQTTTEGEEIYDFIKHESQRCKVSTPEQKKDDSQPKRKAKTSSASSVSYTSVFLVTLLLLTLLYRCSGRRRQATWYFIFKLCPWGSRNRNQ